MKILHISTGRTWRGGERQTQYLIEGQLKIGHDVHLLSNDKSGLAARIEGNLSFKSYSLKDGLLRKISAIRQLKSILKNQEFDIIHAHDSHGHTLIWMLSSLKDMPSALVTKRLNTKIKKSSLKKYNHPSIKKIVCISNAVYTEIAGDISNPDRLEVIPSGIRVQKLYRANWDNEKFNILYVSAFSPEKNHEIFLKTAVRLSDSIPNKFVFNLVGDGPLFERLKSQYKDFKNIQFEGFKQGLSDYYKNTQLLFHPSKMESLGTSILDAMAYGLPIVASEVGGIPEIVVHGQNGLLSNPMDPIQFTDSILHLSNDKNEWKKMSIASIEKAQLYSIEKMIQNYEEVYKSIVV